MAVIVGTLWIARYAASFGPHPLSLPRWSGWFDQGRYTASALAFFQGDLSAGSHWYPIAYPLLGAPFAGLAHRWGDCFFVADLLLFVATCVAFTRTLEPIGIGRNVAAAIFVLSALVVEPTARLWVIPWTTTLSAALTWWLLALAAEVITAPDRPVPLRTALVMGCLSGVAPFARPTELLTVATVTAFCAVLLVRRRRLTWRAALTYSGAAVAMFAAFASLYLVIYGPHPSGYMVMSAQYGFVFSDLPWKAYTLIYTAQPWYPDAQALTERLPWLLPGAAGLVVGLVTERGHARIVLLLLVCVALPYCLLFLAYTDLQPPGLWRFNNAHYFKWLFPLFGAGVLLWWRALVERQKRLSAAVAFALVLAPAFFRITPALAREDEPARLLLFRGAVGRDWHEAYFAPVSIVDTRGAMLNIRNFHQLPDPAGERAIAITRLFAARPRRFDPGEDARLRGEPPYARYRERVSFGLPCWFGRGTCAFGH